MKRGHLSEFFEGVALKKLTRVDATENSNQHEVGTTVAMRSFLGEKRREFPATFFWLAGEQESFSEPGTLTLYDSRENQAHRSAEWRLYYPSNAVTAVMDAGDTLFLAKRTDRTLLFIVTPFGNYILYLARHLRHKAPTGSNRRERQHYRPHLPQRRKGLGSHRGLALAGR